MTWRTSRRLAARAASSGRRGELTRAGVTSLHAWRGRSSWLARASTVLGRQVGRLGELAWWVLFPSLSIFFPFCRFVAFLKMLRHFQKS